MDVSIGRIASTPDAGVRPELVRTLQACLAITLLSLVVTWAFSKYVMTPEAYHSLLGSRMESARIDRYVDLLGRTAWYAYIVTAVAVLLRLFGTALLVQFFSLCGAVELPLRRALFVSACGYTALLCQSLVRLVYLGRLHGSGLTEMIMAGQPGSLARLLDPASYASLRYVLLSMVSISEVAWVGVMVLLLGRVAPIRLGARMGIVLAVWVTTSAFQAGLAVYLIGLVS